MVSRNLNIKTQVNIEVRITDWWLKNIGSEFLLVLLLSLLKGSAAAINSLLFL